MGFFKSVTLVLFTVALAICSTCSIAQAGIPQLLSYQGFLTDDLGTPLTGSYSITFSIYSQEVGGTAVWSEVQLIDVSDGTFSAKLGSVNALVDSMFTDSLKFLGVKVGAESEMERTQLTASPFAYRIGSVDGSVSKKLVLYEAGVNRVEISTGNDVMKVYDQDNDLRIRMRMGSTATPPSAGAGPQIDGGGAVEFFSKPSLTRRLLAGNFESTDTIGFPLIEFGESSFGTGQIETFDSEGRRLTKISSQVLGAGSYETYLPDSTLLTTQTQVGDSSGFIATFGSDGDIEAALTSLAGVPGNGFIAVYDSSATSGFRGGLLADFAGDGHLSLRNHLDQWSVEMSNTGGAVDGGFGDFFGSNGSKNVRVGPDLTSGNRGRVAVYDSLGIERAAIYVDDSGNGVISGDVKTFVSRHPYKTGMSIRYASLEGPEAAAYFRGTATLINGTAIVEFPEHFEAVINAEGMTVQVTPLSANTPGLAVIEKSSNRIVVKELQNGTGQFDFDFTVTAVRRGFENFEIIQPQNLTPTPPKFDPSRKLEQAKYDKNQKDRSE